MSTFVKKIKSSLGKKHPTDQFDQEWGAEPPRPSTYVVPMTLQIIYKVWPSWSEHETGILQNFACE